MNSVARVKALCKNKKIPISKLERELGFANGYIGQLKKGSFPDDRLIKIAAYLDVPLSDLTGETEKPASVSEGELSEEERKFIEWYRTQATDKEKAIVMTIVDSEP